MSDKKIVMLTHAVTYKGVDYAPGRNEMPKDAAELAVSKNFGEFEKPDPKSPNFVPLPYEETMQKFEDGDDSDEVFDSLKFYQAKAKLAREAEMTLGAFLEKEAAEKPQSDGDGNTDSTSESKENRSENTKKDENSNDGGNRGFSEDIPMRHVLVTLGENYDSDEKIKALSREELIKLPGIAAASADKILAYFEAKK